MPQSTTSVNYIRCSPNLYFQDGDITLAVPISTDGPQRLSRVFKVDKVYLTRSSSVFAEMFSAPQSNIGVNETYDGVPRLVEVSDDADDWEMMLSVLYYPAKIRLNSLNPDTPLIAAMILRISQKYDMPGFRDSIVEQIEAIWPTNLPEYDEFVKMISRANESAQAEKSSGIPEPASLIRLARDFDIPSVLPGAFYWLATRVDPTLQYHDPPGDSSKFRARLDLLDSRDIHCLHIGSYTLQRDFATEFGNFLTPAHNCYTLKSHRGMSSDPMHRPCREILEQTHARWIKTHCIPFPDPLTITSLLEDKDTFVKLCFLCQQRLQSERIRWRNSIWDSLPQTFRLTE